jgi:hypothetical protein
MVCLPASDDRRGASRTSWVSERSRETPARMAWPCGLRVPWCGRRGRWRCLAHPQRCHSPRASSRAERPYRTCSRQRPIGRSAEAPLYLPPSWQLELLPAAVCTSQWRRTKHLSCSSSYKVIWHTGRQCHRLVSRALDARALLGLSAEARWGQMVRGGRSWPSEWKAGTGAESAGNATEAVTPGCPADGTEPTMEAMQQPLAQNWQVATPPVDESSAVAAPLAWWCDAEWSACMRWSTCMSW